MKFKNDDIKNVALLCSLVFCSFCSRYAFYSVLLLFCAKEQMISVLCGKEIVFDLFVVPFCCEDYSGKFIQLVQFRV